MSEQTRVERISHRGAKRELPENTLPAFQRAFDRGADAIELDVHATSDGVVIVHHDPTAHSADGRLLVLADSTWRDVETVRFAGGIGIPRLADVLAAVPAAAAVYVEIKGQAIESLVAATIRESRARCAVHSFDHDAIVRMRRIAPEIPRGILYDRRGVDVEAAMARTGARDVWPQWKLIDRETVELVHARGGRVCAWTVNGRVAEIGIDAVCTDDVRLFRDLAQGPGA